MDNDDEDFLGETEVSTRTFLFHFKSKFSITIPRSMEGQKNNILNTMFFIIVSHTLFKHQEWHEMGWRLWKIMTQSLSVKGGTRVEREDKIIYRGEIECSGRLEDLLLDIDGTPVLYNRVNYCGCLQKTQLFLHYSSTTYLAATPSLGLNQIHEKHGYLPVPVKDTSVGPIKNLCGIFSAHQERHRNSFDHELAWATAFVAITGHRREK